MAVLKAGGTGVENTASVFKDSQIAGGDVAVDEVIVQIAQKWDHGYSLGNK